MKKSMRSCSTRANSVFIANAMAVAARSPYAAVNLACGGARGREEGYGRESREWGESGRGRGGRGVRVILRAARPPPAHAPPAPRPRRTLTSSR